jgi:hypothetical protein
MYRLAQFLLMDAGGGPANRLHSFDIRVQETLAQHTLTHHPAGAKEQNLHGFLMLSFSPNQWQRRGFDLQQAMSRR